MSGWGGIIAGAMAGGGEALQRVAGRDLVEMALREREERLAEIAKEGQRYGSQLATERETATEARAEGRRKELGEAVTKARTGQVDDPSGTVRARNPREAMEAERDVYAGRGLVNERLQTEQLIQRDDEGRDRRLDRAEDNRRADRQLTEMERHHKATESISAAASGRLAKGAELDNAIKQITLDNHKRVEGLRKDFATATPERKKAITEEIQIITGKDNDNYLPVPLKDDMGNVTGYKVFDKKRGEWVEPKGAPGAGASPANRPPLSSFGGRRPPLGRAEQPGSQIAQPASQRGGLANVLDQQRPRQPRPTRDLEEEDRMLAP